MRWKLMPVEPTEAMRHAFQAQMDEWMQEVGTDDDLYTAMLAAAPPASQDEALVGRMLKLLRTLGLSHVRHDGIYEPNEKDARAVLKTLEGGE